MVKMGIIIIGKNIGIASKKIPENITVKINKFLLNFQFRNLLEKRYNNSNNKNHSKK